MTKTEYAKYLNGPGWQAKRKEAIEAAGDKCERCELPRWLAEIAYDQDLNVHHLTYANKGDEQPEDLEVLCRRCHEVETYGRSELREVKKAKCEGCYDPHWNYRSRYCSACVELREEFEKAMFRLDQKVDGQDPYWLQTILWQVFQMVVVEGTPPERIRDSLGAELYAMAQLYARHRIFTLAVSEKEIPF